MIRTGEANHIREFTLRASDQIDSEEKQEHNDAPSMAGLRSSDRAPTHNKPTKETPPPVEATLPAMPTSSTTDPKFTPTYHHPFPTSTHPANLDPHSQPLPFPPPLPLPFHPLHQERSYLLTSLQHADSTATHLVRRLAQTQSKLDRLLSPPQGPSPPSSKRGAKSIPHLRRQQATLKRRLKDAENEERVILAELGRVVGKIQRVERWIGVRAGPATSGRRWDGHGHVCWVDESMAALTLGPDFELHRFHGATRSRLPIHMSPHQPTHSGGAGGGGVLAPPAVYWTPPSPAPSYNTATHPPNTDANAHHIYAHEPSHQSPNPPTPHPLPAIQEEEEEVGATTSVFETDDSSAHQQKSSSRGCVPKTTDTNTEADGRSIVEVLLDRAEREGRADGSKLQRGRRASARARTKSLPVLAYGAYMEEGEGTYMGYGFVDGDGDGDVGFGEGVEMVGRKRGRGGRARSSI